MTKLKYIVIALTLHLCLVSCSKDEAQVIESELQTHFTNFEIEANAHGISIDISSIDINGYIQNIESSGTLGQCKSYSDGSQKVIIDDKYWNRITEKEKEYIVFHELGHCLLNREHNDTKDENGNCKSIMQSGINECTSVYDTSNRSQLLAELFSY